MQVQIRTARPSDYDAIAPAIDQWWGRPIAGSLPRLFLDLFYRTSLVIDGPPSSPAGPEAFLIGIMSPSDAVRAYIHFVGVAPHARRLGYGRLLYEEFFRLARADGRRRISAVTAPENMRSADFHRAMGFTVTGPVASYNGPGRDMLIFGATWRSRRPAGRRTTRSSLAAGQCREQGAPTSPGPHRCCRAGNRDSA